MQHTTQISCSSARFPYEPEATLWRRLSPLHKQRACMQRACAQYKAIQTTTVRCQYQTKVRCQYQCQVVQVVTLQGSPQAMEHNKRLHLHHASCLHPPGLLQLSIRGYRFALKLRSLQRVQMIQSVNVSMPADTASSNEEAAKHTSQLSRWT
jgi:hypothetical protein